MAEEEAEKVKEEVERLESKGPIESPQLKETPNYQSGAPTISENDLT